MYTEYVEKCHETRVLYGQELEADQRKTEQFMSVPDHAAEAWRMAPAMRPKNDSSDAIVGLLLRSSWRSLERRLTVNRGNPSAKPSVHPSDHRAPPR